jgi:hypothetical protein
MQALNCLPCCDLPLRERLTKFDTDNEAWTHDDGHCACLNCLNHFRAPWQLPYDQWRYKNTLNDKQASDVLSGYRKSIFEDHEFLSTTIQRHGDRILSRRRKRSPLKRQALIEAASPGIPHSKGFIVDIEFNKIYLKIIREEYRKCLLLPYLDVQTLAANRSKLFGILHHRATHYPQEWVSFDYEQLTCSWTSGHFDVEYNPGCVHTHGVDYGTLAAYDKSAIHRLDAIGFPRGRLVIEAQATLMAFLRHIVECLLVGLDDHSDEQSCAKWTRLMQDCLKFAGEVASWSSFTHQPFSALPSFDPVTLKAQAEARVQATSDHLWLLQTEPSYFKRYTNMIAQNFGAELFRKKWRGGKIIIRELLSDAELHWFWQDVVRACDHVIQAYTMFQDSIHPRSPLPIDVNDALNNLGRILATGSTLCARQLDAVIPHRPGFQHMHDFVYKNDHESAHSSNLKNQCTPLHFLQKERLFWCLAQIRGDIRCLYRFPSGILLDMLEDHLNSASESERARLDEYIYGKTSNYISILEMLNAVRTHRLRIDRTYPERIKGLIFPLSWRRGTESTAFPCSCSLVRAMKHLRAIIPPSGRKDLNWLSRYEAMHAALNTFWKKVAGLYENYLLGINYTSSERQALLEVLEFWKSAEYQNCLKAKRESIISETTKPTQDSDNDLFLPLPSTEIVIEKDDIAVPKIKVKTRNNA